jgi:AraC-like DNA-binding protein
MVDRTLGITSSKVHRETEDVLDGIDMAEALAHRPAGSRYWRAAALGGVECLRARFTTHRYARHWHDGYALGVVVDGAEQYTCNGRLWHASPLRTIIAINPGEVHDGASAARDGWAYRMVYPPAETLEALGEELAGHAVRPTLRRSAIDDPELARRFVQCHQGAEDPAAGLESEDMLLAWFASLLQRHAEQRVTFATPLPAADPRVKRVRELIDTQPAAEITLEQMSSVAGIGRFHLVRSFARAYGMTPHAWQIQCRLVRARHLIDQGHALADAAALAGFCDQSHLTHRFRRAYGITPGEYRRTSTRVLDR